MSQLLLPLPLTVQVGLWVLLCCNVLASVLAT